MKRLIAPLAIALAVSFLAAGAARADTRSLPVDGATLEAVFAAKPPQQTCPGQFDISRTADIYDCTLQACNQWCIEEGARYSAFEVWISPGICACRCCP